jgi:hypothetical protein
MYVCTYVFIVFETVLAHPNQAEVNVYKAKSVWTLSEQKIRDLMLLHALK